MLESRPSRPAESDRAWSGYMPRSPEKTLLHRVFEIAALRCPRCGSTLRLIAAIEDPAIARRILECIGLPARAPPISPAASSDASFAYASQVEEPWDVDQTPLDEDP
jgi:hypothetical protein